MMPPREEWTFPHNRVGRRVLVFDEVDSTNSVASARASSAMDGVAIVAENQTAGRGRFSRVWRSRPGDSLLLSIILYPPPELRRPSILTAWAALGVAEAIYALTGQQARIKWPNDVLVRGHKICGILIEQGAATIIGIGLNLNQPREEFEAAGLPYATSLAIVSGKETAPRSAAEQLLRCLDAEYHRLLEGERVAVEAEWKWRTGLLGQSVEVELTDGSRATGRLVEMSFDALHLEAPGQPAFLIVPERVEHIRLASKIPT